MHFAIIGHDRTDGLQIRLAKRDEHRAYLHADLSGSGVRVVFGGPLLDESTGEPAGTLIVVEAPSLEDARHLADNDPYTKAGLFEKLSIQPWRFAIGQDHQEISR